MTGPGEEDQDLAIMSREASTEVANKILLAPGVTDRMLTWRELRLTQYVINQGFKPVCWEGTELDYLPAPGNSPVVSSNGINVH